MDHFVLIFFVEGQVVYRMQASILGWATLCCAGGEVIGLLMVSALSHRFELWVSAAGVLGHQWLFGAVLFVLVNAHHHNWPHTEIMNIE